MLQYHSYLFPSRRSLLSIISHSSGRGGTGRSSRSSLSTKPPPPPAPPIPNKEKPLIRTRLNRGLPKFLHPYTKRLISAPLSHITSFLILHELSALVPLVGLFGVFHYTSWLPAGFGQAAWAREKAEKLVRYLETKAYWKGRLQRVKKKKEEEEEGKEGGSKGNLSSSGRMGERISRILLEYASSPNRLLSSLLPSIPPHNPPFHLFFPSLPPSLPKSYTPNQKIFPPEFI